MKFLVFWELDPEDLPKALEKNTKAIDEGDKNPGKYPRTVFIPHTLLGDLPTLTKDIRGVSVWEADSLEQLAERGQYYLPEMRCTFVPIEPGQRRTDE